MVFAFYLFEGLVPVYGVQVRVLFWAQKNLLNIKCLEGFFIILSCFISGYFQPSTRALFALYQAFAPASSPFLSTASIKAYNCSSLSLKFLKNRAASGLSSSNPLRETTPM